MESLKGRKDLKRLQSALRRRRNEGRRLVSVCCGSGCRACGAEEVKEALEKEVSQNGLQEQVEVKATGCHGFCEKGPIMVIHPEGVFYSQVNADHAAEIVRTTLVEGDIVSSLLYKDPATKARIAMEREIPFYKYQSRLIFKNNGLIDPTSIRDYLAAGGYDALSEVLFDMTPDAVIEIVKKSGLRGRGGGGFLTGVKWASCREAEGKGKYVICNADEGDPGAYMDRSLLEGNPHSVLEGMIIGAYAIGAGEGFVYVRHEYPLAVKNTITAIKQAEGYGLLGDHILGTDFSLRIRVSTGAGAFVCGESTALMQSLEGKVGRPRAKYIHTIEKGYHDSPSNLNNVETWANVPMIINHGADWYADIGTEKSKGTKIFSLVGKVKNTGLVEVPMGTPLRKIIYDIGGGILKDKPFKAVQTGGPSGGCIPENLLDLPVDYERLTEAGSMMGSGGMIVMDRDTCMVDVSRYFVDFLKEESCGQCIPCREGIKRMVEVLTDICEGKGKEGDVETLEELGTVMKRSSLCALGTSAPNPVLTTIKYFRDEYDAHIQQKKCPAGVCKALFHYEINAEKCTGCRLCALKCPEKAIMGEKKAPHHISQDKCVKCGICYESCKFEAVEIK